MKLRIVAEAASIRFDAGSVGHDICVMIKKRLRLLSRSKPFQ